MIVESDKGKIWVSVERKVNLGNYESVTLQAGLSLPHDYNDTNFDPLIEKIEDLLEEVSNSIESKIMGGKQ